MKVVIIYTSQQAVAPDWSSFTAEKEKTKMDLMECRFPFKWNAKLHYFLAEKEPTKFSLGSRYYALSAILKVLCALIAKNKLYSDTNPFIILLFENNNIIIILIIHYIVEYIVDASLFFRGMIYAPMCIFHRMHKSFFVLYIFVDILLFYLYFVLDICFAVLLSYLCLLHTILLSRFISSGCSSLHFLLCKLCFSLFAW